MVAHDDGVFILIGELIIGDSEMVRERVRFVTPRQNLEAIS